MSPLGLSALEAVHRKLEEDRARVSLASSIGGPASARAAGGAARAACFLKVAAGGRATPEDAAKQPSFIGDRLVVDAAVQHPLSDLHPPLAACDAAPAGDSEAEVPSAIGCAAPASRVALEEQKPQVTNASGATAAMGANGAEGRGTERKFENRVGDKVRACGGGGGGGGVELCFQSNRENFTHILRFLRDGRNWKPPESWEERESLREEALYFGCPALVGRLAADEADRQSDDEAVAS